MNTDQFAAWWNSPAADAFRAAHEDMDGEEVRVVWDAASSAWANGLHAACMNIPCDVDMNLPANETSVRVAYKYGHRDARHAAADLVQGAQP